MKTILRNNLIALFIHLGIAFLTLLVDKQMNDFGEFARIVIALFSLLLYLIAGYLLTGNFLRKSCFRIKNLVSFVGIAIIGFVLWSLVEKGPCLIPGLQWLAYFLFLPIANIYFDLWYQTGINHFPEKILFIAFMPTILFWVGMELRINTTRGVNPNERKMD